MDTDNYTGLILDGKYRLTALLGAGGNGSVYRAEHVAIGRQVAVKFLHMHLARSEQMIKRFYREAQAAAAIGHKGIIEVFDVGVSPNGEPYLVMEYLEGESLAHMLARCRRCDLGTACGVLEPVLRALHATHAKGIVHRDLKPENIFIAHREDGPPEIKLIDFGISKVLSGSSDEKLTKTGIVMGTPAYMSPEQAQGLIDVDHRTDLYAMGVILYEMLSGALPFGGSTPTEVMMNILTRDPVPPRQAFDRFPPAGEAIVLKALARKPADRFSDALDFIEALQALPEYAERENRLAGVAAEVSKTLFAAGDLGERLDGPGSDQLARAVLSEVARNGGHQATPWTGPQAVGAAAPAGRNRWTLWIGLFGMLAVALALAIVVVLVWRGYFATAPASTAADPVVTIGVAGMPEGARIYFDDAFATNNPFRVKARQTPASLRVEADGFRPVAVSLVPNKDATVELVPDALR